MNINITGATILLTNGTDRIHLYTELPAPIVPFPKEKLTLTFEATIGTGAEYVRNVFGIEPKIIDTK